LRIVLILPAVVLNKVKPENSSKSVRRAISILNCFSPSELDLSVGDLYRKTKIPKATLYRILSALTDTRLILKNENSGRYVIGSELFVLGSLFLSTLSIVKIAEPVVRSLTGLTNEAFHLGILNKGNIVLLMREESNQIVKVSVPLGTVRSAYASSMGKALLSELSDAEIDVLYPEERLQPLTKYSIATRSELKSELKQIKKTGVSFDRWGAVEGITGISSVIRDASGLAVAALGVSAPDSRLNSAKSKSFTNITKMGASLISYRLGFKDVNNPVRDFEEISDFWEQRATNLIRNADILTATGS